MHLPTFARLTALVLTITSAACGGTTTAELCERAGATGAALELSLDDGEPVREVFLDAVLEQATPSRRIYGFARGLGQVVATLEGDRVVDLTFSLPLRSGAMVEGRSVTLADAADVGQVDGEVRTSLGGGHLLACLPVR